MTRPEKGFGERSNDDIIREILREHASRENPIGRKEIIKHVIAMGYVKGKDKSGKDKSKIERKAIEGFVDRMGARVYETEEECDEIIRECRVTEREVIFIKKGQEGRTIGYWMMETLSDTEWMFLMDSVLNSKILTKKEADNLANRITFLAGKRFSDLTNYRHSMGNQPYFVGDDDIDEKGNEGKIIFYMDVQTGNILENDKNRKEEIYYLQSTLRAWYSDMREKLLEGYQNGRFTILPEWDE